MLNFAAFVPHPPIAIPTVGKENLKFIKKTVRGFGDLAKKIGKAAPQTIIIISPHGQIFGDAFCINLSENYYGNFKDFGDLSTQLTFKGDIGLAHQIREGLETKIPLTMISDQILDHGVSVPLYYLSRYLSNFNIIPISYSLLDRAAHIKFGALLKEEILKSNKKIAIIASGDLSHRLTVDAPAGYSPRGTVFDQKIVDIIKKPKTAIKSLLDLDESLLEEAGECGFRSLLVLIGALSEIKYRSEIISYEGPFGVGYLIANFKL
ncbi:MAG: AmmeMemoRadiSam system protein B [Patescibacteria group bacterium]